MSDKKPELSENELKRLIALDRAAVEERLDKSKTSGRKIGAIIAVCVAVVALIVVFAMTAIASKR